MKVRVTMLTENDRHLPAYISKEKAHDDLLSEWKMMARLLETINCGHTKCTIESVEIMEGLDEEK